MATRHDATADEQIKIAIAVDVGESHWACAGGPGRETGFWIDATGPEINAMDGVSGGGVVFDGCVADEQGGGSLFTREAENGELIVFRFCERAGKAHAAK